MLRQLVALIYHDSSFMNPQFSKGPEVSLKKLLYPVTAHCLYFLATTRPRCPYKLQCRPQPAWGQWSALGRVPRTVCPRNARARGSVAPCDPKGPKHQPLAHGTGDKTFLRHPTELFGPDRMQAKNDDGRRRDASAAPKEAGTSCSSGREQAPDPAQCSSNWLTTVPV